MKDVNGTVIFTVDKILPTFVHQRKLILDPVGNTILTLRKKAVTAIDTWQVFRGESEELEDLIFTAKRHSLMDINTQLDVFLANNKNEQICDFKIKGTFLEESCDIYAGDKDSAPIIAKMQKRPSAEILFFGKTNFMVRVNPNVDHAFIVALVVILDEMLVVNY
ncbi:protein LURP-one-related 15-like isoform X2 [Mercurialis annua]|uniref:protein LURP-one-related 15-like isoform X2 n=1 Tax=Mercurialis annua TaxID=3986 RepID=UPI002160D21D|nr:protein LURP-one-related 15-like isoform X2 [Mercurialis annua]